MKNKGLSRRRFLEQVGVAGGSAAVYETMTALGLINMPAPWTGPPQLPRGVGANQSVVILGAGIGGLTAATMLTEAGYTCRILEAQNRLGGRNFTARNGTPVVEISKEHGRTTQVCKFDPGLYLNMGPGRIPYHHRRVLHYCEDLGVPLEVYVMETMANLFQTGKSFDAKAKIRRQVYYDMQGYISELLAKAISKKALDAELDNEEDRDRLLCLLQTFGDLGENKKCKECGEALACVTCGTGCIGCVKCAAEHQCCFTYWGSTRTGCAPTVHRPCEPMERNKLSLHDLLRSEFWQDRFYQALEYEWQPTLFQPVGGMDQIVEGFKRKLRALRVPIGTDSEVTGIHLLNSENKVEVTFKNTRSGTEAKVKADYCVGNIPIPILKKIRKEGFSQNYLDAIEAGQFAETCKLGWQANERFWEKDNEIYGGISYADDMIVQMWYPSNDYFSKKGTLTGLYNYDEQAREFGALSLPDRIKRARQGALKLHPEKFRNEAIVPSNLAISIAWHNVPYQEGGWVDWKPGQEHFYSTLLKPDGRFHMVGDQVSTLPGWQEGAMMSAEHAVSQIGGVAALAEPQVLEVPNSRRLVQGRH